MTKVLDERATMSMVIAHEVYRGDLHVPDGAYLSDVIVYGNLYAGKNVCAFHVTVVGGSATFGNEAHLNDVHADSIKTGTLCFAFNLSADTFKFTAMPETRMDLDTFDVGYIREKKGLQPPAFCFYNLVAR